MRSISVPLVCLAAALLLVTSAAHADCSSFSMKIAAAGNVITEMRDAGPAGDSVKAAVLEAITPTVTGGATAKMSFEFTNAAGDVFTVAGTANLSPTDSGSTTFEVSGPVSNGSGSYASATGTITVTGSLDVNAVTLNGSASGQVCK